MSDKETITIEVDAQLKQHLERAARAEKQTLETAAAQALRLGSMARCPTCGRANEPETVPAGMTDAFREFFERYAMGGLGSATITTLEGGASKVYWVNIRPGVEDRWPLEGMVMVDARLARHGNASLPIGIPRGVITGWRGDMDGRWYGMCVAMGYADGNAPARQVAHLMKQQGQL